MRHFKIFSMIHLSCLNAVRLIHVGKVRLYSACLISDKHLNNSYSPNHNKQYFLHNDLGRRHFSLQTTVESIIKTQSGIFKSLSESVPVSYVQDFLLNVHSSTGLPWWGSIILSTVVLRSCVTVPLAIYQNYILAKLENLQLEMPVIVEELKTETGIAIRKFNWDERQAKKMFNRSINKQWNKLVVRDNCHPFKASILLWVQLPMWVCLSISLRNLVYMLPKSDLDAQITLTELTLGGISWIPNLAIPDTSLILPVTLGLINLAIIEIQAMSKNRTPTKFQRYATHFFRCVSILMIPISATVPSCLALYWVTSSTYGLLQNLTLMSPKIRRLTRIPKTASEIEKPYSHLMTKIQQRFSSKTNVDSGS